MNIILKEEDIMIDMRDRLIPQDCLSFTEMADQISIYNFQDYNRIIESMGNKELLIFESTGSIALYEAGVISGKFIENIKKMSEKIENFWDEFDQQFADDTEVIYVLKTADLSKIPNKKFGMISNYKMLCKEDYFSNATKFCKKIDNDFKELISLEGSKNKNKFSAQADTLTTSYILTIYNFITGLKVQNLSAMKKALKVQLYGDKIEINKAWIISNISNIISVIDNSKIKAYSKSRRQQFGKIINTLVGIVKRLETNYPETARLWAKMIMVVSNTLIQIYGVEADTYRRRYVEYKSIAMKIINSQR